VKRRFVGTVLVGFGVLFLVLAIGLPVYVAPAVTRLPNDLQACPAADKPQPSGCIKPSVAEAAGATFLQIKDGKPAIQRGTLRSTTEVLPRADVTAAWQRSGKLGDDAVVWDVYGTAVWTETKEVISAYSTELALDRASAAAIDWDGQWLDDADLGPGKTPLRNVKYEGQTYKFPFGTDKIEYKIFDRDLRRALPARFREVTSVNGVEAYKFDQVIDKQELAVPAASLGVLLSTFAPGATSAKVLYSNTREVWVEPTTGAYLNVRERQLKTLVPDTGSETTLLDADFRYTTATIDNSVKSASNNVNRLKLVNLYGPIVFGILAVLAIVGGLLLARRRESPTFKTGAWDETLPKSRHRLRGEATGSPDETSGPLTDTIPGTTPTWSGPPR